jgi:hypothetical protein
MIVSAFVLDGTTVGMIETIAVALHIRVRQTLGFQVGILSILAHDVSGDSETPDRHLAIMRGQRWFPIVFLATPDRFTGPAPFF